VATEEIDILAALAAQAKTKADEELQPDPGKISATGAIGRKLTYTDSERGGSDYGVFVRVTFIDETDEPGWFFSSSEILVEFFDEAKVAELYPFVAIIRKKKGDYGKLYVDIVR
jgi:hypothetical protein